MPIYQNSIIYKLCHQNDLQNENIYIGSTTNFRTRKNKHKTTCNNEKDKKHNSPVYQYIRDNGCWDEWQMIPIEVFPCNDKKELEVRERYHIELLKSKLNKTIPTRTLKEYYQDNKERIKEYKKASKEQIKAYKEANKEKIAERLKKRIICDHCGCEIINYGLNRHKKTNKCKNYNITKE